ncbi:smr (Small MutS Related) domain-containing protein [Raphanus sativus]|uniref:SMR domain-containing protein At5g58720 isoform X2 n=1 Tax=Raphanus sativus TaxID=3726 RepID=A0A6J0MBM1_RAPSA|nr:SMR domain-containing protein At5g58720 isoform X2 [Raphanus sativus]KAJ4911082.1 smr (Small MutS Related) domain-containing protein [Raphanus sativus]
MKHKSQQQQKRKKKRSSSAAAASDGNKKDVEEERRRKEVESSEKQKIDSLMEAFCSVSAEEATAAYKEAGGDLNRAAEVLSNLVDDDPSAVSVASGSSGQETGSTSEYGAGESSSCGEDLTRERWFNKGSKQSRVIAATGMVSSVIAKDYLKPNPVNKKKEFPLAERSSELCGKGKKAGDREKAEQFLSSMLGDDCELSMAVVRDVLCQCGYDVDMALNVLLDMSSSSTDDSLSGRCSGIGLSDSPTETSFDIDTSESEPSFWGGYSQRDYSKALMSSADPFATRQESSADPFATSQGSSEPCDPQKVLESLFNVPRSLKHEPKAMNWRNVAKKMQSLGIDGSSSSGEGSQPDTLAKDDGYHELRKGATDQWNVTKSYYQKAAEAYSKGGRAHAAYLSEKGRAASKLAQRADERASKDIFVARNKGIENVITIDLHGQHVKQAMKLLKMHLLLGSYVPSVQTLRVITGCGSHGFGKSKVKQSVTNLLERERVRYYEENKGTLLIKLEGCSREFSFLDTESDSE